MTPAKSIPKHIESYARLIAAAYLTFAVIVAGADILFILRHHITFPFGDQWVWLARLYERGVLGALFSQYNEHRLTVPGLFFLADYRLFGGHNAFLMPMSLLFQLACAVLLILPLWALPDIPKTARYIFCGFVLITMFWFVQAEDLFYPYQIQIFCANFGILAGLHVFSRIAAGETSGWLWPALIGCAFLSTFSFGDGILIWPVLLVSGAAARIPRRSLGAIAVAFLCAFGLYLFHYRTPPGSVSPLESLRHPLRIIDYAVTLLGLPFFGMGAPNVTLSTYFGTYAITAAGILVALAALLRFARTGAGRRSPEQMIYCPLLLVNFGVALLAALGRSHFPIDQALSSRYAPMPLIFWISLAALVTIELFRREAPGGFGRPIWCVALVLASAMTLSTQRLWGPYFAMRGRNQAEAAISISVGAPDPPRIEAELSSPGLVSFVDGNTRRVLGHSLFALPENGWLGTPLPDHFQIARDCTGSVDDASPILNSGVRLAGWAWDRREQHPSSRVWVTDSHNVIRGLGVTGESRSDLGPKYHNSAMESAGWVAYSRVPPGERLLTVWAELAGRRSVCQIGAPRPVAGSVN